MRKSSSIGAGIAGLTAAIALIRKGIDVTLLEQADGFREIGAGIQIASNGALVLRELGLETKLARLGVVPLSYDTREFETGRLLFRAPLGEDAARRYGALLYNVHRADLIDLLVNALPPGVVRLGAQCIDIGQSDAKAWVKLQSGETLEADVLIGADGIHSAVRKRLHGEEPTHFAGLLMWRALVPAERLTSVDLEERGNYWVGPGRTVISYWVRPKNSTAFLRPSPTTRCGANPGPKAATSRTSAVRLPVPSRGCRACSIRCRPVSSPGCITAIRSTAGPMAVFRCWETPPIRWCRSSRKALCQGMEDAWTLATLLARGDNDVPAALLAYQCCRAPRTTRIQSGARAMVKLVHEHDVQRIRVRNGRWKGMSRIDPLAETTWGFAWDYDVLSAVNQSAGEVLGVSATREGFQLARPESRRAFDLWKHALTPEDAAQGYDGMRRGYERFLASNFPLDPSLNETNVDVGGVPAIRLALPASETARSTSRSGPTVLHFHGGGYVLGSAASSREFAGRLARAVGAACLTVDYRLAPEHAYPAALDDALDAYRGLLATGVDPRHVLLSGESSGGGLALALAMALRAAGDPLPAGIIAICPFADLTLSGASVRRFNGNDPAANRDGLTFLAASYFQGTSRAIRWCRRYSVTFMACRRCSSPPARARSCSTTRSG